MSKDDKDNVIDWPVFTMAQPKWTDSNYPLLSFHHSGEVLASLKVVNGQLVFEGNADEAAKMFLENIRLNGQTMLDRIQELEATKH